MKKLHLVGFTDGDDGLILSPRKGSKTGGFVVSLDESVLASIDEARRRRAGGDTGAGGALVPIGSMPRPSSALSPREIQARLRAGSSTAQVAAQAGVPEEWVERFADPIRAEQARVVEQAQRLVVTKARLGPSAEPLAAAVQWNLTDRGVRFSNDVFDANWSAYNLHGARWAVRFSYVSRRRPVSAEWEVDLRAGGLTARNRLGAELGHVEAGRRRPRLDGVEPHEAEPPPLPVPRPPAPAPRPAGTRAAPTRAAKAAKGATTRASKAAPRVAAAAQVAKVAKTAKGKAAPKVAKAAKAAPAPTKAAKAARKAKAVPATKAKAPVRAAGRQGASRPSRPAKKPPDAPGARPAAAAPADERPSHLARPPSPMNRANRASVLAGRRGTSPFAQRPAPAPGPAAPRRVVPVPPVPVGLGEEPGPSTPQFDPAPAPDPSARPAPMPAAKARGAARPAPPPAADDRPAVVILSTPSRPPKGDEAWAASGGPAVVTAPPPNRRPGERARR